jgi:phosphoglycolate phosphatase-like HAD superfamily hydrolase
MKKTTVVFDLDGTLLDDNCMPISVLLDTAKIFKAKLIIYQEHCHNMMLDPAWEIVAEDILGFILV